ncbi:hypothetical protein COB52_06090 [Candidatus Kaiserbacteria bacterium]|nr:MAG: hypothetical protein COB52_06090 [Candidatus Kaiserbacteria bacterium]
MTKKEQNEHSTLREGIEDLLRQSMIPMLLMNMELEIKELVAEDKLLKPQHQSQQLVVIWN